MTHPWNWNRLCSLFLLCLLLMLALYFSISCRIDPTREVPGVSAHQLGSNDGPYPLIVGAERTTDAPIDEAAISSQWDVAVAQGKNEYLLVWRDKRRNEGGDIFGARMALDGTLLDPHGIPISTFGGTQEKPRVAFDGTNYLVVWTDWRLVGLTIHGARVTPAGKVLEPDGFQISFGQLPDVAFDGTNYLVTWEDKRNGNPDIYAARVTPGGKILDAQGIPVCTANGPQTVPSIAFGSSSYLLSWLDNRAGDNSPSVYGGRLTSKGTVTDGSGFLLSASASAGVPPRLAFDGTNFAVVWQADGSGGSAEADVHAIRVSKGGVLVDPAAIPIVQAGAKQGGPVIAFDGQQYLIAWHHQSDSTDFDIHAIRLGTDGKLLDSSSIVVDGSAKQQARPAVASNGGKTLIAWDGDSSAPWEIYATQVSTAGTVTKPGGEQVTRSANAQYTPHIAPNGSQQLLVWTDSRKSLFQVYAQHLAGDGTPMSAQSFQLSNDKASNGAPVVCEGHPVLVTWHQYLDQQHLDIVGTRVGTSGGAMDPSGLLLTNLPESQEHPAIAYDGTNHLVVWSDQRPGSSSAEIYGARVTTSGQILDKDGIIIAQGEDYESDPDVVFGAGVYLVAWHRIPSGFGGKRAEIQVALLSKTGKLLGTQTLKSPNDQRDKVNPAVAFDGTNFLVVWEFHEHTGWNIFATRVTPQGTILDQQGIAVTSSNAATDNVLLIHPSVVFNGSYYVIGWQDEYMSRVEIARLSPSGQLLDSKPVVVSQDPLGQKQLRLGLTQGEDVIAVYERYDLKLGSWRVGHRRLSEDRPAPDEAGPGDKDGGSDTQSLPGDSTIGADSTTDDEPPAAGGCSCSVSDSLGPQPWLLLFIAVWLFIRRRLSDTHDPGWRSQGPRGPV